MSPVSAMVSLKDPFSGQSFLLFTHSQLLKSKKNTGLSIISMRMTLSYMARLFLMTFHLCMVEFSPAFQNLNSG